MKIIKALACLILASFIAVSGAVCERSAMHPEYMTAAMIEQNLQPADSATLRWTNDSSGKETLPSNYRSMLMDMDKFAAKKEKLGYDCSYEGLSSVKMSGSAEFNEAQFVCMIDDIKSSAGEDVNIVVVDMRQECHMLINGISASLKDPVNNYSNVGMSTDEVLQKETELENEILNTEIQLQTGSGKNKVIETVNVGSVMTERELCEKYGAGYLRLASTDHIMVPDVNIDAFIDFVKQMPENTWLHFHCAAGVGRTGIMMCIYDMMMNPDLSIEDIAERQQIMGADNILSRGGNTGNKPERRKEDKPNSNTETDENTNADPEKKSAEKQNDGSAGKKDPYQQEKTETMQLLYQYIKENHAANYQVSWTEYHEQHRQSA